MIEPYYHDPQLNITIYHGEAGEVMPQLRADLLCTDPPYGIKAGRQPKPGKLYGRMRVAARDYGEVDWDDVPVPRWMLDCARSITKYQIIFGGNYFELPPARCWLVWDKDNGDNDYADCEMAWTNLDKPIRKIRYRWMGLLQEHMDDKEPRYHPTQKPVHVMQWCLRHAPGDVKTTIDPFMGSGTTLIAAKNLGMACIGIERSKAYCDIAIDRLRQEVFQFEDAVDPTLEPRQLSVFEAPGEPDGGK